MQMFYLYIMYIFIDAKVNHTTSVKNAREKSSDWLELMIWI